MIRNILLILTLICVSGCDNSDGGSDHGVLQKPVQDVLTLDVSLQSSSNQPGLSLNGSAGLNLTAVLTSFHIFWETPQESVVDVSQSILIAEGTKQDLGNFEVENPEATFKLAKLFFADGITITNEYGTVTLDNEVRILFTSDTPISAREVHQGQLVFEFRRIIEALKDARTQADVVKIIKVTPGEILPKPANP